MSDFVFLHFTSSPCQHEYDIVSELYEKSEFAEYFNAENSYLVHCIKDLVSFEGLRTLGERICSELADLAAGENLIPCISVSFGGASPLVTQECEIDFLVIELAHQIAVFILPTLPGCMGIYVRGVMSASGRRSIIITPILSGEEECCEFFSEFFSAFFSDKEAGTSCRVVPNYETPFSFN